jgi:hypothetical protein
VHPRSRHLIGLVAAVGLVGVIASCTDTAGPPATPSTAGTPSGTVRLKGEVWADNWFALWVDERAVAEDSVPFATERSFNAETFTFDATYPFRLNFVVRDYLADDSGLEYIGTPRQQIGDGGFIAQFTDTATGAVVAVTDARCACLVVHTAPLDPNCASAANPSVACSHRIVPEPAGWKAPGFDTGAWPAAREYTAAAVGVKDGYTTIRWDEGARLVWSDDLKLDNTLLCTMTVDGPMAR